MELQEPQMNSLEEAKSEFLVLADKYEALQAELDIVRDSMNRAMQAIGVGQFLQNPDTKIVYNIVEPNGTFVYFKKIDYVRTKKDTERAGSLSAKKAEEAGFDLSK